MDFYSNFLNQCAKNNISASGAAAAIGLSNAAASGWKKGKIPQDVTLQKLADYFGCTVEDLTRRDIKLDLQFYAKNEEKPAPGENELSKKEQLLNLIDSMDRAELIDALKAVTAKLEEV